MQLNKTSVKNIKMLIKSVSYSCKGGYKSESKLCSKWS